MAKLYFTTPWCTHCKSVTPRLEGRDDIEIINADERPELVAKLGVRGVPTLIDGDQQFVGATPILQHLGLLRTGGASA